MERVVPHPGEVSDPALIPNDLGDVPAGVESIAREAPPVEVVPHGRKFDHRFANANDGSIEPLTFGHKTCPCGEVAGS
jgi:hypothetical protein